MRIGVHVESIYARTRDNVVRYGLAAALANVAVAAVNHVLLFKILKCVHIGAPDPSYARSANRYQCQFLDRRALAEYSKHTQYELPPEFLQRVLAKGDECFGVWDGDVLASYGWYSNKPTDVSDGLTVYFDSKYIYMYNGFTHPGYRGKRLHAIGMTMALKEYLNRGFKGLVSTVDFSNFGSLKSVYRMGYRDFGRIYVIRMLGRHLIYCTNGCTDYRFEIKKGC